MTTKHSHYLQCDAYTTKDGSLIRELMHPEQHSVSNQSLAEATIPAGVTTLLHYHEQSEELYHITVGQGLMMLGDDQFSVNAGDTICIQPGTPHSIKNTGTEELVILCCCAPAYSHEDTVLF